MRTLLIIYTDQLGTRFICPESETKETNINNKKHNKMRTNVQSRIELALLGITTILMVVLFNLFANF